MKLTCLTRESMRWSAVRILIAPACWSRSRSGRAALGEMISIDLTLICPCRSESDLQINSSPIPQLSVSLLKILVLPFLCRFERCHVTWVDLNGHSGQVTHTFTNQSKWGYTHRLNFVSFSLSPSPGGLALYTHLWGEIAFMWDVLFTSLGSKIVSLRVKDENKEWMKRENTLCSHTKDY